MADTLSKSAQIGFTNLGNATSETQFTGQSSAVASVQIPVENGNMNKPLCVRVGGRVTGGSAGTFTARLYWGASATIASNTRITTDIQTLTADTPQFWFLETYVAIRETNPSLAGTIDLVYVSAIGTSATALEATSPALLNARLSITGQFSASDTDNTAYVDFFEIQGMVS